MNAFPLRFKLVEQAYGALAEALDLLQTRHDVYFNGNQLYTNKLPIWRSVSTQLLNRARILDIQARLFVAKSMTTEENREDVAQQRNEFELTATQFHRDCANLLHEQIQPGNIRYASYAQLQLMEAFGNLCCTLVFQAVTEVNLAELYAWRRLSHYSEQQTPGKPQLTDTFEGIDDRYRALFDGLIELLGPASLLAWLDVPIPALHGTSPKVQLSEGNILIIEDWLSSQELARN